MNEEQLRKNIGQILKYEREKKGITQEKLAESIGMSPVNLSIIENGKAFPKFVSLYKIIKTLGLQPNGFFGKLDMIVYDNKDIIDVMLSDKLKLLSPDVKSALIDFINVLNKDKQKK